MDCPFTPNFIVVNLASQAEAVARYVQGWPKELNSDKGMAVALERARLK
jgi:hypothetical protein